MDYSRVPHDLQTGEQFHKARRATGGDHADALALVGGGVLRPVFRELIPCSAFIIHARRLVASKTEGKSGCRVATWTCVQLGRAVSKCENTCDPSDTATNAILSAKVVIVILHLRRPAGQSSDVAFDFSCC